MNYKKGIRFNQHLVSDDAAGSYELAYKHYYTKLLPVKNVCYSHRLTNADAISEISAAQIL